jgi:hypothetical protein
MQITFYGVVIVLMLWSLYGYFGSHVEQAEYSIIKKTDEYETRNYPAHIVAQTTVSGSYQESMSNGFRIVAEYIFGGNVKKEKIAMTAPVVMQEKTSESIAMTAPVIVSGEGGYRTISFGMPKSYTLETLPTPTDSRVKLVEVPNRNVAVMKFSGLRTTKKIQDMEKKLRTVLSVDGVEAIGLTSYAGYNAPWTPPWMTRNEVLVEVK